MDFFFCVGGGRVAADGIAGDGVVIAGVAVGGAGADVGARSGSLAATKVLSWPPSVAGAVVGAANDDTLACMRLSPRPLKLLRLSSSVMVVSAILGGAAEESPPRGPLAPFICCISSVMFSVFMLSRMFAVAVGRRASTVNVQSSWFCSKRRRRLEAWAPC